MTSKPRPEATSKPRPEAIIKRPRDVMALLSVSRHGLTRMIEDGGFPKPIKLGPRSIGFIKVEVDAWLNARMAARDAA